MTLKKLLRLDGVIDIVGSKESVVNALDRWKEPHRFYHNEGHLLSIIRQINEADSKGAYREDEKAILTTVAIYHDAIYDPKCNANEQLSADLFYDHCSCKNWNSTTELIHKLILDTANDTPDESLGEIGKQFHHMDRAILRGNFKELLDWEKSIFKEFQHASVSGYKRERVNFLKKACLSNDFDTSGLESLIKYVESHRPSVGIYAGSFNPFHIGHLNVLQKSEAIFDKVIVALGENPEKEDEFAGALGSIDRAVPYREITTFYGFVSDFITKQEEHADITLIRGLRNGNDLDYEANQLRFIKGMKPDIKVVYIPCDPEFEHISSSAIRNIMKIDYDKGKEFLVNELANERNKQQF
jgi:pantetheine-phosphate adenylyltransferase